MEHVPSFKHSYWCILRALRRRFTLYYCKVYLRVWSTANWSKFDLEYNRIGNHGSLLIGTLALVGAIAPPLNSSIREGNGRRRILGGDSGGGDGGGGEVIYAMANKYNLK
ncbi:hypothetical protein BLOT_010909 [Blomia tropicalis]|nr:hypothetical protein BLOT_010909 [Blomia tropicalis]